jgi:hypothetical protein
MARNQAARKAAKAIRRKAVVAAKRSAEATVNGVGGQVREGAELPILQCHISDGLFDCGAGFVTLARGVSREYQYVAFFMVDSWCLGVKHAVFQAMDRQKAERLLGGIEAADPGSPVSPAEARKLLRDVVAWARSNGFPPHKDYDRVELLFGDVVAGETDYTPRFGSEGKVLYLPGPMESRADVRRRLHTVQSRFGDSAVRDTFLAVAAAVADGLELELEQELEDEDYETLALE